MAYTLRLDNTVAFGGDVDVRLLEVRADTREERDAVVSRAERKGWSLWLSQDAPGRDAQWGAVLEKGMPEKPDFGALLLMEQLRRD